MINREYIPEWNNGFRNAHSISILHGLHPRGPQHPNRLPLHRNPNTRFALRGRWNSVNVPHLPHPNPQLNTATSLSALLVFMFSCCTLSSLTTASRQLWAFARDAAVPNAPLLSSVHPRMRVPVVSICVTAGTTCLLSLINIGSTSIFNAIVSLTVAGFFGSYLIPFTLLLYTRITRPATLIPGPWSLGRYGVFVNAFTIVWCSVCMFF